MRRLAGDSEIERAIVKELSNLIDKGPTAAELGQRPVPEQAAAVRQRTEGGRAQSEHADVVCPRVLDAEALAAQPDQTSRLVDADRTLPARPWGDAETHRGRPLGHAQELRDRRLEQHVGVPDQR